MAYQSSFPSAAMYLQELIDEILDCLHHLPSALKAGSLVARKFYPRTRVHLFREADCYNPESARVFSSLATRLSCSSALNVCLDFFLPNRQPLSSLCTHSPLRWHYPSGTTALGSITRRKNVNGCIFCLRSYPQLRISSSPDSRSKVSNGTLFRVPPYRLLPSQRDGVAHIGPDRVEHERCVGRASAYCSSHQKDACRHRLGYDPQNLGRFSFVSVYVHSTPEEFHAINASPDELGAVVQTVNLVPNGLKVLEIDCIPCKYPILSHLAPDDRSHKKAWDFTGLSPNVSPLHLNPATDVRLGGELNNMLPFINWWINCFKTVDKETASWSD